MKTNKALVFSFVLLLASLVPMVLATKPIVQQVTGGGWYIGCNGNKCTFGFNAEQLEDGSFKGNVEFVDHGPVDGYDKGYPHVHGYDITDLAVSETSAEIWGTCRLNGDNGPYDFYVYVEDNGEPGTYDWFYIAIPGIGYESGGELGFPDNGGGNIQIHVWL